MSDNTRVGGKANDGKNSNRRRKYRRMKKKLREISRKETGISAKSKTNKKVAEPISSNKKQVVKSESKSKEKIC